MRVLDLFSGIGGFSLGLERAGMTTVAFCEIDPYCRTILKKHWPHVPVYNDIRDLNGQQIIKDVGQIEVICGGFPCQPWSAAGKQRGKDDNRHLWPEMFRLIREIRPRWVIGENVAGIINMALDDVLSDMEGEGYTCRTFVIPACAVGGIHRRDRVWIVANAEHAGRNAAEIGQSDREGNDGNQSRTETAIESARCGGQSHAANAESQCRDVCQLDGKISQSQKPQLGNHSCENPVPNTNGEGLQGSSSPRHAGIQGSQAQQCVTGFCDTGVRPIDPPTQPPVCHRDDGVSDRVARLKALGNAVVPQIPEIIGRGIMAVNNDTNT